MNELPNKTEIFKFSPYGETLLGYLDAAQQIYQVRWGEGRKIGRVDEQGRVFRATQYDERELGQVDPAGHVHSHGLFEGGVLGWVDPDGVVVQGGLILGEEEVGRVVGPSHLAAGAALLLLFLPEAAEADRKASR